MAKFIALVSHEGPLPAGFADQPAPKPADFGSPTEDDGPQQSQITRLASFFGEPVDTVVDGERRERPITSTVADSRKQIVRDRNYSASHDGRQ